MKKIILSLTLFLVTFCSLSFSALGQTTLTCGDVFMDSGGLNGDYEDNEQDTTVFCPTNPDEFISIHFTVFSSYYLFNGNNIDEMFIFNGDNTNTPAILTPNGGTAWNWNVNSNSGTGNPVAESPFYSTHSSGCLTVVWSSDESISDDGWVADVNCIVPTVGCTDPCDDNYDINAVQSAPDACAGTSSFCGCLDPCDTNYDPTATYPYPGSCSGMSNCGCTDPTAVNYNPNSTINDNTCLYPIQDCGIVFTDIGGVNGDYYGNQQDTIVYCPSTPGEIVVADFTYFVSQEGYDEMLIFNGFGTDAPPILNGNGGTEWEGENMFSPNNPVSMSPFYANNQTGCLTFVWSTNANTSLDGWQATVDCILPIWGCTEICDANYDPSATIHNSGDCSGDIICGCLDPLAFNYNSNADIVTDCIYPDLSCGDVFTDSGGVDGNYGNNEQDTTVICPNNQGESIVVDFISFDSGYSDRMRMYDGPSTDSPIILNPEGGSIWRGYNSGGPGLNDLENPVLSSPFSSSDITGCMTFVWSSDGSSTRAGWEANIDCIIKIEGCTDPCDENYIAEATESTPSACSGNLIYCGCTYPLASNYNPTATIDDGSCEFIGTGCPIGESEGFFYAPSNYTTDCDGNPIRDKVSCGLQTGSYFTIENLIIGESYCFSSNSLINGDAYSYFGYYYSSSCFSYEDGSQYFITVYDDIDSEPLIGGTGDGTVCLTATSTTMYVQLNLNDGTCGISGSYGDLFMFCETCGPATCACTDPLAINYDENAFGDDGSCIYDGSGVCSIGNWTQNASIWSNPPITSTDCLGIPTQVTIASCAYAGEHVGINYLTVGETYCFSTDNYSNDVLNIYEDDDEPPVMSGLADGTLCYTATKAWIEVQVNLNDGNCGTEDVCREVYMSCSSCPDDSDCGCIYPIATNYDPDALIDDGSCEFLPFGCGGLFTDNGGVYGNYAPGQDTVVICPDVAGEVISVEFYEFDISYSNPNHKMYIHNGANTDAPLIVPNNPLNSNNDESWVLENGYGGAPPIGTASPIAESPFTSSDATGCLTFVFNLYITSTSNLDHEGWVAGIYCNPPSSGCFDACDFNYDPLASVSDSTACSGINVCGCMDPLASNYNPIYTTEGPCEYLGGCGQIFTDSNGPGFYYPPNENYVQTICPDNEGEVVSVGFTQFYVRAFIDVMLIFDGPNSNAPLILTPNGETDWTWSTYLESINQIAGTANPIEEGPFTSTDPSGCLTFAFTSAGIETTSSEYTAPGWQAMVTCFVPAPLYGCTDICDANYDVNATINDIALCSGINICGCTDPTASNFNNVATLDVGSCIYQSIFISGCTDPCYSSYNPNANISDEALCTGINTCGCTDINACNYNPTALTDDGSCYPANTALPAECPDQCDYLVFLMTDVVTSNDWQFFSYTIINNGTTITTGTFDPIDNSVSTYDLDYICPLEEGCYHIQVNGESWSNISWTLETPAGETIVSGEDNDDGFFTIGDDYIAGCTDLFACNYNPDANCEDDSCYYPQSSICINPCEETYQLQLHDSFSNGWNGEPLIIYNVNTQDTIYINTMANADQPGTYFAYDYVCILEDGCYVGFAPDEAEYGYGFWSIRDTDGSFITSGGTGYTTFTIGNPEITCSDDVEGNDIYHFNMTDFTGNGWNGATYSIYNNLTEELLFTGDLDNAYFGDGLSFGTDNFLSLPSGCYEVVVGGGSEDWSIQWELNSPTGTLASGGAGTTSFSQGGFTSGCTNANACNYNPVATCEDGSCEYGATTCDASCGAFEFWMSDADFAGWSGATYSIEDNGTGAIIATGSLTTSENNNGYTSGVDYLCDLPNGCYSITVGGGSNDAAIQWELLDPIGAILSSGGEGSTPLLIGSTATTAGCTDIAACNYDANAICEDDSCVYPDCIGICDGLATGPNIVGMPCDDGNNDTFNDIYNENCDCIGNAYCSYNQFSSYSSYYYSYTGASFSVSLNGEYCSNFPNTAIDANTSNSDFGDEFSVVTLIAGNTYQANININLIGYLAAAQADAWIDYNNNGVFEETELLWEDPINGPFSFTVPTDAVLGQTAIRFSLNDLGDDNSPCSGYDSESFWVNIIDGFSASPCQLDCSCTGCLDVCDANFNPQANTHDDSLCSGVNICGCADPTACNYDPAMSINEQALCEFGATECSDPCGANYLLDFSGYSEGTSYEIINLYTNEIFASGGWFSVSSNWYNYPPASAFNDDPYLCPFPDGCYKIIVTTWWGNPPWTLYGLDSLPIVSNDPSTLPDPEGNYPPVYFSIGEGYGCSDPSACNFDPNANPTLSCNDFTCDYGFDYCENNDCLFVDEESCDACELYSFSFYNGAGYRLINSDSGEILLDVNVDNNDEASSENDQYSVAYLCNLAEGCYDIEIYSYGQGNASNWFLLEPNGAIIAQASTNQFVYGNLDLTCNDVTACNYDPNASACSDDSSCIYPSECLDPTACNFNPDGICSDNSNCIYEAACNSDICTAPGITVWNENTCSCEIAQVAIYGCTDQTACNYNPQADCDNASCIYETTCNNDLCTAPGITEWNDITCSCQVVEITVLGCIDPNACNYNPDSNCSDDAFCLYGEDCTDEDCIFPGSPPAVCDLDYATPCGEEAYYEYAIPSMNNFSSSPLVSMYFEGENGSLIDFDYCAQNNYTALYPVIELAAGETYSIDLSFDYEFCGTEDYYYYYYSYYSQNVGIWIDFNQNNLFEEAELIGSTLAQMSPFELNVDFTVPSDAVEGLTGFRLIIAGDYDDASTFSTGCIEDYFWLSFMDLFVSIDKTTAVGCIDPNACNYNPTSTDFIPCYYGENYCETNDCETVDGFCPACETFNFGFDSDDGSISYNYILTNLNTGEVVLQTNTTNPDINTDSNFHQNYLCNLEQGCYSVVVNHSSPSSSSWVSPYWNLTTPNGASIATSSTDTTYFVYGDIGLGCNGCTDINACNYDPTAIIDDGSCIAEITIGCTDPQACNFNPDACQNSGCIYEVACEEFDPCTFGAVFVWNAESCACEATETVLDGCIDPTACNYNEDANCDDGSCLYNNDCPEESFSLAAKIFLEGPYIGGEAMNPGLGDLIPLEQPYKLSPYNYEGEETALTIPINAIDWVLVEMRSGTPSLSSQNTIVEESRAGFLLNNGNIVDTDGISPLAFENLNDGEAYHICIRHRNHLDVLSATPVLANATMTYDFTTAGSQAFGLGQLKEIETNVFGLYAGDYTQEGVVQTTDYDLWFALPASLNTYSVTDGTLDGVVQNTDFDKWFNNKAKLGIPEVRFD